MLRRVLPVVMIAAAGCGGDPELEDFEGTWRLISVNAQPLPALGTATPGELWAAAVLQLDGESGTLERCMEDPSTETRISRSSPFEVHARDAGEITLAYYDRSAPLEDNATLEDTRLILRYRNTLVFDVLVFVPLTGDIPGEVCDLAP
jgi:hypothetical protein